MYIDFNQHLITILATYIAISLSADHTTQSLVYALDNDLHEHLQQNYVIHIGIIN